MFIQINKNKKPKSEKVIIDSVQWDRKTGKPDTLLLPIQIVDNAFTDGRSITVRLVDKLAYEYDRKNFDAICQKFGLSDEDKEKLKALIFLNSGYVNQKLLREHSVYEYRDEFGLVGNQRRKLVESLYAAKQAAPPPKGRTLYRLASYEKQKRQLKISKNDIKDILQILGMAAVAFIVIMIIGVSFFNDKDTSIYVKDADGNYVLDENGKAITKQEQCYENRKLGAAMGFGNTNGHCTLDGQWVQD